MGVVFLGAHLCLDCLPDKRWERSTSVFLAYPTRVDDTMESICLMRSCRARGRECAYVARLAVWWRCRHFCVRAPGTRVVYIACAVVDCFGEFGHARLEAFNFGHERLSVGYESLPGSFDVGFVFPTLIFHFLEKCPDSVVERLYRISCTFSFNVTGQWPVLVPVCGQALWH